MLEELASQFNLRVQEVIQRLEDLQESGRITGIIHFYELHVYSFMEFLVSTYSIYYKFYFFISKRI